MSDPRRPTRSAWSWILGIGAASIAAVVILAVCAHYDTPPEFWTYAVPGTLTGAGTIGLAFATVLMASAARRDSTEARKDRDAARAERDRERTQKDEVIAASKQAAHLQERRAQAEQVKCTSLRQGFDSAWMLADPPNQLPRGTLVSVIVVDNTSKQDITDVKIQWAHRRADTRAGAAEFTELATRTIGDIKAQTSGGYVQPNSARVEGPGQLIFVVSFADNGSVRWRRDADGELVEL